MPERPSDYKGDSDIFKAAQEDTFVNKASIEENDGSSWIVIVVVCSIIIVAIAIGSGIYYYR